MVIEFKLLKPILLLGITIFSANITIAEPDKFKVGVIQSLTGIAAEDGKNALDAILLAQKQINLTSKPEIKLLIEDDGTDPKQTVSAYQKLKNQGVELIIGPTWSFTVNSIVPLAARDKIILVNTSTIPECLNFSESNGYLFSNGVSVNEHVKAFELYLNERTIRSAAIFYTNNSWGQVQEKAYSKVLNDKHIKVVKRIESSDFDQNDWKNLIPAVRNLKVDLWLLLLNKTDIEILVKQARQLNVSSQIFTSYHLADLLNGRKGLKLYRNICYPHPEKLLNQEKFLSEFIDQYKTKPKIFSDSSYDAIFLVYRALNYSLTSHKSLFDSLTSIKTESNDSILQSTMASSRTTERASLFCVRNDKSQPVDKL